MERTNRARTTARRGIRLTALGAVALLAVAGTACASWRGQEAKEAGARQGPVVYDSAAPAGTFVVAAEAPPMPGSERLIIRSGSTTVVVPEPAVAAATLTARVEQLGGYVESSTVGDESVHLSARVPTEHLEPFLDEAAALGEEKDRSISGADVTEQYADVEAELQNLLSLRDRLRSLLDKAEKVKEVLEVERELTRVQTRIDVLTGRKERIEKDVALSPVSVTLAKAPKKRILGPLGLLWAGGKWFVTRLFVISG